MSSAGALALSILPLTLLAAISPIVFLNASTVASNTGMRGAAQFVGGNLLVLGVIGAASMGLLGAAAASFTERELASRTVDALLALLLVGYGVRLLRRHTTPAPADPGDPHRGVFAWGAIGMATNFTTLPLYVAVAQRLGSSPLPVEVTVPCLVASTAVVLTPAWLPALLLRLAPSRVGVKDRGRARVARWTRVASIAACGVGGTFLLWHAALG